MGVVKWVVKYIHNTREDLIDFDIRLMNHTTYPSFRVRTIKMN